MEGEKTLKFRVVIVGDRYVGKTTFFNRNLIVPLPMKPFTTIYNSNPIFFHTNHGQVELTLCDSCQHQNSYKYSFYDGAHAAIIFFDLTSRMSYKSVPSWYKQINRICEGIPIVLVGNKADVIDRRIRSKHILFHRKHPNMTYFNMSAKANYQYEKPLLWIMRQLVDVNLEWIQPVPLREAERFMDESVVKQLQNEVKLMEETPLSPDDQ